MILTNLSTFTQDQFTIEPFQERFDNLCCGYVFNIGVLVQNDFQTCDIPVNGLEEQVTNAQSLK